ncbi:glycosyltransferase [Alteromonas sediminis]|uniref:Glycosyltransferase n=1 Tax=Alteromonas sediminis TaxID=2259342 RepID=A0A3N5Y523_9ALTE|nr:glycosyltransferase [Alteromonas sediminis]RPJ68313.1 glycosyltransferase [Alteromonas sediminis]
MKKVKSLVKRLLGRPVSEAAPVTVDICSQTHNGFVVIGWYFADRVSDVGLVDAENAKLDYDLTYIDRQDVVEHLGRPAKGFQLLSTTELALSDIKLAVTLFNGLSEYLPLALVNADQFAMPSGTAESEIEITEQDVRERASCHYAIVTDTHAFLSGWIADENDTISGQLVTKKGRNLGHIVKQLRVGRSDVQDVLGEKVKWLNGFLVLIELDDVKVPEGGEIFFSIQHASGKEQRVAVQEVYRAEKEPMANLKRLLNAWMPHIAEHLDAHTLFKPIIDVLYPLDKTTQAKRVDVGGRVAKPRASVVIPLYGRYDFMRYQLSHFDRYDAYADVEILYVVDDPRIEDKVKKLANTLSYSIKHPFSVVYLKENVGFGKANNIGVKQASSEHIVLLNSDVLPKDSSWLADMLALAQQPQAGIVGARLLYEDDTIQHDGMAPMTVAEYPGLFFNDHPKKGWPKHLVAVPEPEPVSKMALLTAACWVMKKALFEEVGGFAPEYILGDFEDSDMCLKVLAKGYTNYMDHGAELYHLERQSQNLVESGSWKHNVTILNAITFNRKWEKQLNHLVQSGDNHHG